MSTKDSRILSQNGGRYPFKVSDEYFDNLTARIMEQIPEEDVSDKNTKVLDINKNRRRNLWISVVSIAASLALIVTVALNVLPTTTQNVEEMRAEYTDDDYNEDLMTYTMADNMAVYDYLSGYAE
ncbi:MAG: hypothetical protein IJ635_10895 [Bacteroidaceae bacterium]|nr:hypothetical protein [Bacteroidaceae bacterium]